MTYLPRSAGPRVAVLLLLTVALLAPGRVLAQSTAAPKKVTTIEGITEYTLDNGLRLLLFPDPSAAKVTVNLTVFVGSRHEGYGETGMAHLLEHMVFKGTPKHPEVPKALRDHGAQFNGTTWVDRTNYFESMPADEKGENLEFGIALEADRLVNSLIRREDLLSEMTVVRNEFEMNENNPSTILRQRMMSAAFDWHNYGKTTMGNRADIERVPIDRLQAFYKKYYRPDNVMLVVAGKFDEKKALGLVAKYFGPLKAGETPIDQTYTEEPAQDGERSVALRRVGKVGVVGALYHIAAGPHEDFAAVEVLNYILSDEPAGRLYQALVTTKKATSISGDASGYHDPGVMEFLVTVDATSPLEPVRDALLELLEKLPEEKFSAAEVKRAKEKILAARERLMASSNSIGITLTEWAAQGDWRLFFLHRDRVAKVTPEDVARVAGRYLQRTNRTVGMFVPTDRPQRTPIPDTPDVAALVKDYKSTQTTARGEFFDPTLENIEQRVQRSVLPSGIKVALLPKKTRGEVVLLTLTLRFGNTESLKGQSTVADFLAPLMERGTKKYSYQQLQDELTKLKATLTPNSDPGEASFTVQAKRDTLPEVLKLIGQILREPTFPEKEFEILKRESREALQQQVTEPQPLAVTALRRKFNQYPKDDVRYSPTLEEELQRIDAVTRDQVEKLYREQFGATAGELVVVGDFDTETTPKLMDEILKDWKAGVRYERIEKPAKTDVAGERMQIDTPDKANAVYLAGHALAMTDSDPDYAALQVGNYLLGGGPLSSRLSNRVRGKEGLSYGVQSIFTAQPLDKSGRFIVFAICNPKNMEKVEKAIAEEVDKLLKEGVSEKELAEGKEAFLKAQKVQRAGDAAQAGLLSSALFVGRTLQHDLSLEKKVAALTVDEVNAALRKHLAPKRLVLVEAGDFRDKATTPKK
jgi:zinc protease